MGSVLVVQLLSGATYQVQGEQCSSVQHHNILRPGREREVDSSLDAETMP